MSADAMAAERISEAEMEAVSVAGRLEDDDDVVVVVVFPAADGVEISAD